MTIGFAPLHWRPPLAAPSPAALLSSCARVLAAAPCSGASGRGTSRLVSTSVSRRDAGCTVRKMHASQIAASARPAHKPKRASNRCFTSSSPLCSSTMLPRLLTLAFLAAMASAAPAAARLMPTEAPEFEVYGLEQLTGRYGAAYPSVGTAQLTIEQRDQLRRAALRHSTL